MYRFFAWITVVKNSLRGLVLHMFKSHLDPQKFKAVFFIVFIILYKDLITIKIFYYLTEKLNSVIIAAGAVPYQS